MRIKQIPTSQWFYFKMAPNKNLWVNVLAIPILPLEKIIEMTGRIQNRTVVSYLDIKKGIETRLHFLTEWRDQIHNTLDEIVQYHSLDEVKDILIQIDDNVVKNKKLKVAVFLEENPDFNDSEKNQVNLLIINSIDILNENADREFQTIEKAISGLRSDVEKASYRSLQRI